MPSQAEILKKQQSQLKASQRRGTSLQTQQEALHKGRSTKDIIAQRESEEERKRQEKISKEIEQFNQNLSFENYEQKYKQLSPEARRTVQNPDELKKSSEYQKYHEQRRAYESAQAASSQFQFAVEVYTGRRKATGIWKDISPEIRKEAQRYVESSPSLSSASSFGLSRKDLQDIEFFSSQGISYQIDVPTARPKEEAKVGEKQKYLGPVPQGADEEKFRTTGITDPVTPDRTVSPVRIVGESIGNLIRGGSKWIPEERRHTGEQPIQASKIPTTPIGTPTLVTGEKPGSAVIKYIDYSGEAKDVNVPYRVTVRSETRRYQDLGYTKVESEKLAKESVQSGGVSFASHTAKRIIRGEKYSDIKKKRDISRTGFELGDITRSSGIGFVSAESEGLRTFETSEEQNVTGVSDRLFPREGIFLSNTEYNTNITGDFLGDILRGFKKAEKETGKEDSKKVISIPGSIAGFVPIDGGYSTGDRSTDYGTTGSFSRISGGMDDGSQSRGFLGNLFGDIADFGKSRQEEKEKQIRKETYSPALGGFVSSSKGVPEVSASTLTFRPSTAEEAEKIKRSEAIGSFARLPTGITPVTFSEKVIRGGIDVGLSAYDFVSVGGLTQQELIKKQEKLNKEIEEFNKKYGERELSKLEYDTAEKRLVKLQREQESIDKERRKKIGSFSYRTGAYIFGTFGRGTLDPMTDETGEPIRVYADTVDIIPTTSVLRSVKFAGTQKITRGGDIATDIIFMGDKGRVGTASAISRTGADDLLNTIVEGGSGKIGVQFPTAEITAKDIESFVGRGVSKQSPASLKTSAVFETKNKALLKLTKIDDIDFTKDVSIMEIMSAKGKKLLRTGVEFPTGKIVQRPPVGLSRDISVSKSFSAQEDDLIKIFGEARTSRSGRTQFEGVIKVMDETGDSGVDVIEFGMGGGKTKTINKMQEKAISDTISSVVGSLPKSKIETAKPIITATGSGQTFSRLISGTKTQLKIIPTEKETDKIAAMTIQAFSPAQKDREVTALQTPQMTSQSINTVFGVLDVQATREIQSPAQTIRQMTMTTPVAELSIPRPTTRVPPFFFFGTERKRFTKGQGAERGHHVYIKRRRISDVPLTEQDALNYGSWVSDNTLAAQFEIKETKQKPQKSRYNIPSLNWTFTQAKFRDYEIRRGKRIPLKNKYIENAPYRLDTEGEVKKIQVARFLAQERKKTISKQKMNKNLQRAIFGDLF